MKRPHAATRGAGDCALRLKTTHVRAIELGEEVRNIDANRTHAEQVKLYAQRHKVTNAKCGQTWHYFEHALYFGAFLLNDGQFPTPHDVGSAGQEHLGHNLGEGGDDWRSNTRYVCLLSIRVQSVQEVQNRTEELSHQSEETAGLKRKREDTRKKKVDLAVKLHDNAEVPTRGAWLMQSEWWPWIKYRPRSAVFAATMPTLSATPALSFHPCSPPLVAVVYPHQ